MANHTHSKLGPDNTPIPPPSSPSTLSPQNANGAKTLTSVNQLSTPPGPPVFTSPVRSAAVPFRTSPALPQPLAFSPDSPLPTSSLPQFSNGSRELSCRVSGGVEDHVPLGLGESKFVLFSAHKVYSLS
ncbi:hypothetical protein TanjilG_16994 [Lupinus angustifolius]|nr:hypothetical protein TanjilG_16994 [Lupinus angustifolius]